MHGAYTLNKLTEQEFKYTAIKDGWFLADEDLGKVDDQFLQAHWWLLRKILDGTHPTALWEGKDLK